MKNIKSTVHNLGQVVKHPFKHERRRSSVGKQSSSVPTNEDPVTGDTSQRSSQPPPFEQEAPRRSSKGKQVAEVQGPEIILPDDIWHYVAGFLYDSGSTVHACAITSRTWYTIFRSYIYRRVVLGRLKSAEDFRKALDADPQIRHWVREICLDGRVNNSNGAAHPSFGGVKYPSWFWQLPTFGSLEKITGFELRSLDGQLPTTEQLSSFLTSLEALSATIRTLTLTNSAFGEAVLRVLVSSFRELQELLFRNMSLVFDGSGLIYDILLPINGIQSSNLTTIRSCGSDTYSYNLAYTPPIVSLTQWIVDYSDGAPYTALHTLDLTTACSREHASITQFLNVLGAADAARIRNLAVVATYEVGASCNSLSDYLGKFTGLQTFRCDLGLSPPPRLLLNIASPFISEMTFHIEFEVVEWVRIGAYELFDLYFKLPIFNTLRSIQFVYHGSLPLPRALERMKQVLHQTACRVPFSIKKYDSTNMYYNHPVYPNFNLASTDLI